MGWGLEEVERVVGGREVGRRLGKWVRRVRGRRGKVGKRLELI